MAESNSIGHVSSKDGTKIEFDRMGKGPAVILVGAALCDRMAMAPVAALLASHYMVFNYDRRGRGAAETPCRMQSSASFPFMLETARTLSGAMPHGTLRTLEGQTHGAKPEVLAPVLIEFFGA